MILNLNDDKFLENPDEVTVITAVAALEPEQFAILSRADEDYVQTFHNDDSTFVLEYRAGSFDQHFAESSGSLDMREVQKAFAAYLSRPSDWHKDWAWEKVDFDEDFEGDLTEENGYLLNGEEYRKIPVGSEDDAVIDENGKCPNCNSAAGQFHEVGCELEECPRCHDLIHDCDCE